MCFIMLLLLAFAMTSGVSSAADGKIQVSMKVQYGQTEARTMLTMINDFRTGSEAWVWDKDDKTQIQHKDLKSLTYDYGLEKVAMQRAAEIALGFEHQRPNGEQCYTAYVEQGLNTDTKKMKAMGENIAAGQTSAAAAFVSWQETNEKYEGQGHRRNMLAEDFTAVGIGHVYYNETHFWVQEFGDPVSGAAQTAADDSAKAVKVEVDQSKITSATAVASEQKLTVACGSTVDLPQLDTKIQLAKTWPRESMISVEVPYTWKLADSEYASLSNGKLIGTKAGTTALTTSVTLDSEKVVSVPVRVTAVRQSQTITAVGSFTKNEGDAPFQLNASAKTELTYRSSDESVVTVAKDGTVTVHGAGTATITITAAATEEYEEATKKVTVIVNETKKPAANPEAAKLEAPKTAEDGTVTWDHVWFGAYPQSQVDESAPVYETLKTASWDENGDATVGDNEYRRARRNYGNGTSSTYYYKYEPIKWRVLSVRGDEALLLADKNLDMKIYNAANWETSTIRSWLNGYGSGFNQERKDYTVYNFMDKAFTPAEQGAIHWNVIQNPDNSYHGTPGGNATEDKIFLLSLDEVMMPAYGFPSNTDSTKNREALNTAYAGRYAVNDTDSSAWWWLRSPGGSSNYAADVDPDGAIDCDGGNVFDNINAVRPALFLNLTSDLWSSTEPVSNEGEVGDATVRLDHITVSKGKTTYKVNEPLDMSDLTVTAFYSDDSSKKVTNYRTNQDAIDMATPGNKALIITYTENSVTRDASVAITVERRNADPTPSTPAPGPDSPATTPPATSGSEQQTTVDETGVGPEVKETTEPKITAIKNNKPKTATLKKVSSTKKGTLKLTWKRDVKATGYQAMVATDKKFKKNKKTAAIRKNKTVTKTFTKLKRGKTYFAKVRAYKKAGKKNIYGAYSKVKKAKVK